MKSYVPPSFARPAALALALACTMGSTVAAQPAATPRPTPAAQPRPAATPTAQPRTFVPARSLFAKTPPVTTFELANGLSAAVLTIDTIPTVSVQVWVRAGSKDEPRNRRGLAQVVARLMWKGTGRVRPDAHAQLIAALGGRVSGSTDEDASYFGVELPSPYLDYALQLEADRLRGLQLREAAVKAEREQIIAELAQEEASPIARALRRLLELSFSKHPYAWPSGGVVEDLKAITAGDAKLFYDTYYVPQNTLIVVVGDASAETVRASLEKHFGALSSRPIKRSAGATDEPLPTAQRREVAAPGQLGLVVAGYPAPAASDLDWAALQVAAAILASGDGGRLKQRLRVGPPKELGLDGGITAQPREHPGLVVALAAYRNPSHSQAVEAALLDELAKLARLGPTVEEVRAAKVGLLTRSVFATETGAGLASALGRAWLFYGDPKSYAVEADRLEAVRPQDVRRVIGKYLRPELATIVAVPPAPAPPPAKAAKP